MNRFVLLLLLLAGCATNPGTALAEPSNSRTNVVFVLDVSPSMDGNKIVQAKEALEKSLKLLPPDSNVGVLIFGGSQHWLVPIGRLQLSSAIDRVRSIGFIGSTAVGDALAVASRALEQHKQRMGPKAAEATFQIVLMSDGESNSGMNPVQAIAEVSQAGHRLNVIGVEFRDQGIMNALPRYGFHNAYHEVAQATKLFETIKRVLKLETINMGGGGPGDISVLANVPPDVLRALLQAIVTAERKTR